MYWFFDFTIQSDIELTHLVPSQERRPDLSVKYIPSVNFDAEGFKWIHDWLSPDGLLVMKCARNSDQYLLRIPAVADFHILTKERLVNIHPYTESQSDSVVQALLDQVLPRTIFHSGKMVVHASAVKLPSGAAVAFVANTGYGKSTLAASYCRSGAQLISDDCLLLEDHGSEITGMPAYPGLRLWPDSCEEIVPLDWLARSLLLPSGKRALRLQPREVYSQPTRIAAVFLLGDPGYVDNQVPVRFTPLKGKTLMMTLIESAFTLDVTSPDAARRNFEQLGRMANAAVPLFKLDYSRSFDQLPVVHAEVDHFLDRLQSGTNAVD